jgi:hypothetical protein
MKKSSREANSRSASQEIHRFYKSRNHCHGHKSQPLVPTVSHVSPILKSYFFKIHFNIILPFMLFAVHTTKCSSFCCTSVILCVLDLNIRERKIPEHGKYDDKFQHSASCSRFTCCILEITSILSKSK